MYKAGTVILFSQGDYSDYCVIGVFRALRDFDYDEERAKFAPGYEAMMEEWWSHPIPRPSPMPVSLNYAMTAELVRKGFVEEIDYVEEHDRTT